MTEALSLPLVLPTREQWFTNPQNAMRLAEILRDPALLKALQVLLNEGLPSVTPVPAGRDPVTINAGANQRREGYYEFYRGLLALAAAPQSPAGKLPEPWSHAGRRGRKRGAEGEG